jgi:hypothetical protein
MNAEFVVETRNVCGMLGSDRVGLAMFLEFHKQLIM